MYRTNLISIQCQTLYFQQTLPLFFGTPGGAFGSYDNDGDLTQIVRDFDGTTTGVYGAMAVRADNYLMRFPGCANSVNSLYAICNGADYGQVFLDDPAMYLYASCELHSVNSIMSKSCDPSRKVTLEVGRTLYEGETGDNWRGVGKH